MTRQARRTRIVTRDRVLTESQAGAASRSCRRPAFDLNQNPVAIGERERADRTIEHDRGGKARDPVEIRLGGVFRTSYLRSASRRATSSHSLVPCMAGSFIERITASRSFQAPRSLLIRTARLRERGKKNVKDETRAKERGVP